MKRLAIYCADIGSIRRGNFGWAVLDVDHQHHGEAIGGLVDDVVANLAAGTKVALGFECPLWVPVSGEPSDLTAGRAVDGNRSWSAAAGTCALAAGLTETAWILKQMRLRLTEGGGSIPRAYLDWDAFLASESGVFLWEAFVAGKAKAKGVDGAKGHVVDAVNACKEFSRRLPDPGKGSVLEPPQAVRSLIGGAVLWAGWSDNIEMLRAACLVIRP